MEQPTAATWSRRGVLVSAGAVLLTGASGLLSGVTPLSVAAPVDDLPSRADIVEEFGDRKPQHFGMFLAGAITHGQRRISLTFDACGGSRGSRYDESVVTTLRKKGVPATLFLNARWIDANAVLAAELAADPLFELGNHGWHHVPLTVRGQSAYGIAGTDSAGAAYDEIVRGLDAVAELTGARPIWFRPGTAWADDVGLAIARRIGVRVVSYSINADAGATASKKTVVANFTKARSKSLTLGHVNQPDGKTAEGLAKALPKMLHDHRTFGTLSDNL